MSSGPRPAARAERSQLGDHLLHELQVGGHARRLVELEFDHCYSRAASGARSSRTARLEFPVRIGRLQNAEFVAVRVGEDVPAPAALRYRRAGQLQRSQRNDAVGFGMQISRAQIQVQPVLSVLGLGHLLQEDLDAPATTAAALQTLASGPLQDHR